MQFRNIRGIFFPVSGACAALSYCVLASMFTESIYAGGGREPDEFIM